VKDRNSRATFLFFHKFPVLLCVVHLMFIWRTRTGHSMNHLALLVRSLSSKPVVNTNGTCAGEYLFLSRRAIISHCLWLLPKGPIIFVILYGSRYQVPQVLLICIEYMNRRRNGGGPGGGCARRPVGTHLHLLVVGNPIAVPCLARLGARRGKNRQLQSARSAVVEKPRY
jgi:hypothetical protein